MRLTSFRKLASTLACAGFLLSSAACSSSLDPNLDNRSCSADHQCVDGYVCSSRNVCVRAPRSDENARSAADGGTSRGGLALDSDAATASRDADSRSSGMGVGTASSALPSAGAAPINTSGSGGTGASSDTAGSASNPMGAGGPAPMPVAGATNTNTAGMPASAGASSKPPTAGRGSMSTPLDCGLGLDPCNAMCVDLMRDSQHCGSCDTRCNGNRSCVAGTCERDKALDTPVPANDVAALATLLALFGLDLSDLAELLAVDEDDLDSAKITRGDLELLGIDDAALGLLGLGIGALALIGIDVSTG